MYWLATAVVIAFGVLAGFTIGLVILPLGVAMAVLGPFRRRPAIFWPPMAGVIAFVAGFLAVAPITCTASSEVGGGSTSVCSSLLGVQYTGTGFFTPSQLPGLYAGLGLALVTAIVVAGTMWRRRRALPSDDGAAPQP